MLIWINGAFGAGKTQTAHELARRLPASHVADPELLGFALHRMLPPAHRGDFQDLPQWRAGVVATLRQADARHSGPVVVPMTLVNDRYFDEIVGGLRGSGVDLRHVALLATAETLRARLRHRLSFFGGRLLGRDETWALQQVERCVAALAAPRYATGVTTDGATIDEVVEAVAATTGVTLAQPRQAPLRAAARRAAVGVRHIRL